MTNSSRPLSASIGRIAGSPRFALMVAPTDEPTETIVSTTTSPGAVVTAVLDAWGYRLPDLLGALLDSTATMLEASGAAGFASFPVVRK